MSEKYITYNIDNNIECYYTYKGYTLENLIKDLNIDNYYILKQIHSNKVFDITNIPKNYEGDGLITNKSNIALVTKSKDCNSIFIIDTKNKILGNIHSGWKGTVGEIVGKVTKHLIEVETQASTVTFTSSGSPVPSSTPAASFSDSLKIFS